MPNYFTDDPDIFANLVASQPKAVVIGFQHGCEPCDMWMEQVGANEEELNTPVFIVDSDTCPKIAESLRFQGFPETIVFKEGKEVKRLEPADTLPESYEELKQAVTGT